VPCPLAAAETNPSAAAAAANVQVPSRFIVESQDTIVAPATTQNQYNACDAPRQFATITGGSHCGFIDSAIVACDSGSLPRAEQLAKTRALMLQFLDTHLRGDQTDFALVSGAGRGVAGTTTTRDARTTASLASASLKGAAGTELSTTLTVTTPAPTRRRSVRVQAPPRSRFPSSPPKARCWPLAQAPCSRCASRPRRQAPARPRSTRCASATARGRRARSA
jgi:hypothetical protein